MSRGYDSFQTNQQPPTICPPPPPPPPAVPYAIAMPDDVSVRVGEVIRLQCVAHGTPPLQYTWSKAEGSLPARAQVSEGDLQIDLATAEDAGNYKCAVTNRMGRSETLAQVTVHCEWVMAGWRDGTLRGKGSKL